MTLSQQLKMFGFPVSGESNYQVEYVEDANGDERLEVRPADE